MDAVTMLGGAASAMLSGHFLAKRAGVVHRCGLTEFEVSSSRPFPWQVDGDYVGLSNRLEFSYEPDVLDLVVP
jgi:diacylglycerol kinase family enzyme